MNMMNLASKYDGLWNNSDDPFHWKIEGDVVRWSMSNYERLSKYSIEQAKEFIDSGQWFRCDKNGVRIEEK